MGLKGMVMLMAKYTYSKLKEKTGFKNVGVMLISLLIVITVTWLLAKGNNQAVWLFIFITVNVKFLYL